MTDFVAKPKSKRRTRISTTAMSASPAATGITKNVQSALPKNDPGNRPILLMPSTTNESSATPRYVLQGIRAKTLATSNDRLFCVCKPDEKLSGTGRSVAAAKGKAAMIKLATVYEQRDTTTHVQAATISDAPEQPTTSRDGRCAYEKNHAASSPTNDAPPRTTPHEPMPRPWSSGNTWRSVPSAANDAAIKANGVRPATKRGCSKNSIAIHATHPGTVETTNGGSDSAGVNSCTENNRNPHATQSPKPT